MISQSILLDFAIIDSKMFIIDLNNSYHKLKTCLSIISWFFFTNSSCVLEPTPNELTTH